MKSCKSIKEERVMMEQNNLKIITNPIVNQSLCTMRNKNTDTEGVRLAARKLTRILLYEATKNLPQKDIEIETPLTKFKTKTINPDITIIITPILRAGLILQMRRLIFCLRQLLDTLECTGMKRH